MPWARRVQWHEKQRCRGLSAVVSSKPASLPPWGVAELPAPPPYSLKNALRVAGAGAIILGVSIGSGEWLIGPAVTAQFTAALLWVATISILLQWVFNEEACRYTLYTGEPIIERLHADQAGRGVLGLVLVDPRIHPARLARLGGLGRDRYRRGDDRGRARARSTAGTVQVLGLRDLLRVVGSSCYSGRKVEQALEYAEWFMVIWIIAALLFLGLFFTSFSPGSRSSPVSWAVASTTSGARRLGELMGLMPSRGRLAHPGRVRGLRRRRRPRQLHRHQLGPRQGHGHGSQVGYIPAAVGGQRVELAATGKVFEPTPENVSEIPRVVEVHPLRPGLGLDGRLLPRAWACRRC